MKQNCDGTVSKVIDYLWVQILVRDIERDVFLHDHIHGGQRPIRPSVLLVHSHLHNFSLS
jgi:hypothetical protein